MRTFLKVLVKKSEGIHGCLGRSDPLTSFGGISIKPGSECLLFSMRKPWLFCCKPDIRAWNMAQG